MMPQSLRSGVVGSLHQPRVDQPISSEFEAANVATPALTTPTRPLWSEAANVATTPAFHLTTPRSDGPDHFHLSGSEAERSDAGPDHFHLGHFWVSRRRT